MELKVKVVEKIGKTVDLARTQMDWSRGVVLSKSTEVATAKVFSSAHR
jgi:hypothetical protein